MKEETPKGLSSLRIERNMITLQPYSRKGVDIPGYKVMLPTEMPVAVNHFPFGFPADYPALVTDLFVRDILSASFDGEGYLEIFIELDESAFGGYGWLPFTLALHAITQAPKCSVFFEGMAPEAYSELLDAKRAYNSTPLDCIRNFVAYLNTPKGDRPERVYEKTPAGDFVPFSERVMDLFMDRPGFTPYYLRWIEDPFRARCLWSLRTFTTHPFDHLPVRNLTRGFDKEYLPRTELKKRGITDLRIEDAVLMHDQIKTVALRPYWSVDSI